MVDIAESFVEMYGIWPRGITICPNKRSGTIIVEIMVDIAKVSKVLVRLSVVNRATFLVDNCTTEKVFDYDVKGCNLRFSNKKILKLIKSRIGPEAKVLLFGLVLANNKNGRKLH